MADCDPITGECDPKPRVKETYLLDRVGQSVQAAYDRAVAAGSSQTDSPLLGRAEAAYRRFIKAYDPLQDADAPPSTIRPEGVGLEEFPEGPDRAIGIVAELKGSASLFAAFAFGALNLPGTLTISESRVTSATSSVSTSRPVPDSDLLQAFVALDAATFAFMLVCVVVCQQLIYRLSDGSYGSVSYSADGRQDPRDSALGRLSTQYGVEFRTARIAFGLGLASILLATVVKTWSIFDSSVALPVTSVIALSSIAIGLFYVRVNDAAFRRLGSEASAAAWNRAAAAGVTALLVGVLGFTVNLSGSPGGVTSERAFQNVVAKMEKAAAAKADAAKAAKEAMLAERAAELRLVEARAAAEQATAERAAAEKAAAEVKAAAAAAVGKVEASQLYAQAAASAAKLQGLAPVNDGTPAGNKAAVAVAEKAVAEAEKAAAERAAAAAEEASAAAEKALAQKAVAEQVASERLVAAEKAASKATAARQLASKKASEMEEMERAAGASMRAAADRAEAEALKQNLSQAQAQAQAAAAAAQNAAIEAKAKADGAIAEALSKAQEAKVAPAKMQEAAAAAAQKAVADAQAASETALTLAQAAVEAARAAPAQMAAEANTAMDGAAADVDAIAELRQRLRL